MLELVERQEWRARRASSYVRINPADLAGGSLHWFGIPDGPSDHARCDDVMRGVQASHMQGEFSDIAYNQVVCQHGYIYEGRGFGRQTGANGTEWANEHFYAICVMLGKGNRPAAFTPAAQAAVVRTIRRWQQLGAGPVVRPHGYFTGSECPGPTIRAWMSSAPWKFTREEEKVADTKLEIPPWLDDWLRWVVVEGRDPNRRPAGVPADLRGWENVWEVATSVQRIAAEAGMSKEEEAFIRWRVVDGGLPEKRPAGLPARIPRTWHDDALAVLNIAKEA